MILYDSPFSPFARKVRLVLSLKGLPFDCVDALDHDHSDALRKVNGRAEVPALIDEDLVVVNSADIVAYLEHRYPQHSILPSCPKQRVNARKWERIADTLVDAIFVDISYWMWARREDQMPEGMLDAARENLASVYHKLEDELKQGDYICDDLSIADIALFPHLIGAKALEVPISKEKYPNVLRWLTHLRGLPEFKADIERATDFLKNISASNIEREKIFWRGDRIEWVLANGFEDWFFNEIKSGRVLWPPQTG
ncbi:MAG: glutathione S-transferase family protein [Cellvibrionaceae bacterium]